MEIFPDLPFIARKLLIVASLCTYFMIYYINTNEHYRNKLKKRKFINVKDQISFILTIAILNLAKLDCGLDQRQTVMVGDQKKQN